MNVHARWQTEVEKPYVYGATDCVMTALRVADEQNPSRKLFKEYVGSYRTLPGAHKELRRRGFKTLVEFFDSIFLVKVPPLQCRLGDIAVYDNQGVQHAAVCLGLRFGVKTETGPIYVPVSEIIAGYR